MYGRGEIIDIMDRGVVTKAGQGKRMMFGEKDERGKKKGGVKKKSIT